MPKSKPTQSNHLKKLVNDYGSASFSTDGYILYCKICDTKVASQKRFNVDQHISSGKHKRGMERDENLKQSLIKINAVSDGLSIFWMDLCNALVSANIPLGKLKNNEFRSFLEKYTHKDIPDESTLRKNYVKECYTRTISSIRDAIDGKKLWVSIDETTDVDGRYIGNVIVGTLENNNENSMFLLTSEVLEKTNHLTICKLFDTSMLLLWPNGVQRDNILLFVTDAAPYMNKAATGLKCLYTKMIHVTCVAHALHRVGEEVRKRYPKADHLISSVKRIFRKAPTRIEYFKMMAPNLALPAQPIITRWGTWLKAASYCSENFQVLKDIISAFDCNESTAVTIAQEYFADINMEIDLAYIKTNFECLGNTITKLEQKGDLLVDSIGHIEAVKESLSCSTGHIGSAIFSKFQAIFDKNLGFKELRIIGKMLSTLDLDNKEICVSDVCHFKRAPITSVDVERSFSMYKSVLADNRRSFLFENLKMIFVIYCNSVLNK